MSFVLDCNSAESTLSSLAKGFECSLDQISEVLLSLDLDSIYDQNYEAIIVCTQKYLYNHVVSELGMHKDLDEVYWFHGTRTLESNEFQNGLDHLGTSLEKVWDIVLLNAPHDQACKNLLNIKNGGSFYSLYLQRLWIQGLRGPHGFLVREQFFYAESLEIHDYLAMPELIADICKEYLHLYDVSLYDHYSNCLIPKLIKFKGSCSNYSKCVGAALGYCYNHVRNLEPNRLSKASFSGSGVKIEFKDIVTVENVSMNEFEKRNN